MRKKAEYKVSNLLSKIKAYIELTPMLKRKKLNYVSYDYIQPHPFMGFRVVYMVIFILLFYVSRKIGRVQQRKEPPDLMISVISTSIT